MGLIAIDLDGTLINSDHRISEKNLQAIRRAQEEGHEVVIATGRAYFDVAELFKHTGLETYIIGSNGATLHNPSGQLLHSIPISEEHAKETLAWLNEEGPYYYEVFGDNGIYTPANGRTLLKKELESALRHRGDLDREELESSLEKQFSQAGYVFVDDYHDIFAAEEPIYNVLVFTFDRRKYITGWERFAEEPGLTLVSSAEFNFELEHRDASKGNMLHHFAEFTNNDMPEAMAIGDSGNDVSMLQRVGYSFAMGNAWEEVRHLATHLVGTNDEDGVAQAIDSYIAKQTNI